VVLSVLITLSHYNMVLVIVTKQFLSVYHDYPAYWGRCGRDRMVVGFTTTYAVSAYHH